MNENQKAAVQQKEQVAQTTQAAYAVTTDSVMLAKCPHCGMPHDGTDPFCTECGERLHTSGCPKCGADVAANEELCPQCGNNLKREVCSFCGTSFDCDDPYCPECGNPRTGIVCSQCSTLNFRNFCRQCNAPLNGLAQQALKAAQNDPRVQRIAQIADKLAQLEAYLLDEPTTQSTSQQLGTVPPQAAQLSEQDMQLVQQYRDMLAAYRNVKPQPMKQPAVKPTPSKPVAQQEETRISLSIDIDSKEEAMKLYKATIDELKATLSAMVPDAGMTPQMQRDYHSARKMEILKITKVKVPLYWRCNAYGCCHSAPNECSKPYEGGEWYYAEKEVFEKTWGYE